MKLHAKIAQDRDAALERGQEEPERSAGESAQRRFVVQARPLGLRHDLNFDKIEAVLELIEGPCRR
jgi:hypothetical protein